MLFLSVSSRNSIVLFLSSQKKIIEFSFTKYKQVNEVLFIIVRRLKKEWISMCNLPETITLSSAYICSKHFSPDDFSQSTTKRMRLKKSATPSIFFQEKFVFSSKHSDVNCVWLVVWNCNLPFRDSSSTSTSGSTVEKTGTRSYHYCIVCKCRTLQSTSR